MELIGGRGKPWLFALKIAVSATLLAFLVGRSDLGRMVSLLRGIDVVYLGISLALMCGRNIVQALRWQVVLRIMKRPIDLLTLVRLFFVGIFFNLLLPSAAGGDFVRGWLTSTRGLERGEAMASVLTDRLLGIFTTVFLAAVSAIMLRESIPDPTLRLGVLILPVGCAVLFWLLVRRPDTADEPRETDSRWVRLKRVRSRMADRLRTSPGRSLLAFGYSLCGYCFAVGGIYSLAVALEAPVSLPVLALLLPLVWLFTMLPLSVGGFGLREGAMVFFLGQAGVESETALGICLLWVIVMLAQATLGAALFALEHVKPPVLPSARPD